MTISGVDYLNLLLCSRLSETEIGRVVTCGWLIEELSRIWQVDQAMVRNAFGLLPQNLGPLLDSSDGLTALSAMISPVVGHPDAPMFYPLTH